MFFWKLVLAWSLFATASTFTQLEPNVVTTIRTCEGNDLNIACDFGNVLGIVYANYGRISSDYCPSSSVSYSFTGCRNPQSFNEVILRCANRNSCYIPVNSI